MSMLPISVNEAAVADVRKRLGKLKGKAGREASQRWVNWIGIESQGEMRKVLPSRFQFRGTAEGFRKAVVFQSARVTRRVATQAALKIGAPGFTQSRTANLGATLARHEEADQRTGHTPIWGGGRTLFTGFFLPAKGLRTSSKNPPRRLYPVNIGVLPRIDAGGKIYRSASKRQKTGKQSDRAESFYVIENVGIFMRKNTAWQSNTTRNADGRFSSNTIGKRSSKGQPIWWFTRRIRTKARLGLWDTARKTFDARGLALGMQAIEETLYREGLK